MDRFIRTAALASVFAAAFGLPLAAADAAADAAKDGGAPLVDGPTWQALQGDILGDALPAPADGRFTVDAPYRAEDAATVPIRIRAGAGPRIETATVVIDENPAPVAGEFVFGPAMAPLDFEMRVRVNQYSNVRVIAGYADGPRMDGRFIKASGGCSAPASRDPAAALADLGEMKLRLFGQPAPARQSTTRQSTTRREAQVMIRHPNYSGLQQDQITHLFIPAHFLDHIEVWQGEEMLFSMDGGISISENPAFRFGYADNGAPGLRVIATDTDGNRFDRTLAKAGL